MSKPSGWVKLAEVRSCAAKMVSDFCLPGRRLRPAGLKWIESWPLGSAVTALPSDIATGLVARLSVSAAWAGAGSAAAEASAARRIVSGSMPASEVQRHAQREREVRRIVGQADRGVQVQRSEEHTSELQS